MADNRIQRESQTREATARKKAWENPELLPNPKPQAGFKFRWIRVSTYGEADARNISSKLREGWEPVLATEHPEIELLGGPEIERFKDNIIIGGLMLCKAPDEMIEERDRHYHQLAEAQVRGVDNNFMRENDPRMPKFVEARSRLSFGKGNV